jgi:TonB family protein
MEVTDILRDRMHEPVGLQRMVAVSIAAHIAFGAALLLVPARLFGRDSGAPKVVMTISLGGNTGPDSGGMTQIGGRAVQVQTPPEDAARREPVRPPAAKAPEMVLPRRDVKVNKATTPAPKVTQAPDDARGRTPSRGAQTAKGSTSAETLIRGQGFGLSTGGQGFGGTLDVANFCCPEYLQTMVQRIRSVWAQNQGVDGLSTIKFTIQRDGKITDTSVERSSGNTAADLAARRAVAVTQLPPLPDAFTNPTLTVNLHFVYQR